MRWQLFALRMADAAPRIVKALAYTAALRRNVDEELSRLGQGGEGRSDSTPLRLNEL